MRVMLYLYIFVVSWKAEPLRLFTHQKCIIWVFLAQFFFFHEWMNNDHLLGWSICSSITQPFCVCALAVIVVIIPFNNSCGFYLNHLILQFSWMNWAILSCPSVRLCVPFQPHNFLKVAHQHNTSSYLLTTKYKIKLKHPSLKNFRAEGTSRDKLTFSTASELLGLWMFLSCHARINLNENQKNFMTSTILHM